MNNLNDCFASVSGRLTMAEAVGRFVNGILPVVGKVNIPLAKAPGRILSADLTARITVPPRDNSAVDGYLVYFDDLAADTATTLPLTGRISAGHSLSRLARKGEALSIFTGAQIPLGEDGDNPDTIFMLEDGTREGNSVSLPSGQERGANLRKAGEDVMTGDVVLKEGRRLRPQDIGMAAALGCAKISVRKRLKVAIFSTGDEICDPGKRLKNSTIYDINRYTLLSLLQNLGCKITDIGILPDNLGDIRQGLIEAAKNNDLLITSGGVSKGEEDHVRPAVESLGALHTWNLLIKPGRPIALGHVLDGGRQVPLVGLPGNPVAVLVTFIRIARPIILLLAGSTQIEPTTYSVPSGFSFEKKPGRREWLRVRLQRDRNSVLNAIKYPLDGSGILTSMVASDGLAELSEETTQVSEGDMIDYLPFSELMR